MATRKEEVWDAKPHTKAKVAILKSYLDAWFPIMGTNVRSPILYIDGFAGPGRYANHADGSPITALRSAIAAVSANRNTWKAGPIYCVFIEENEAVCARLRQNLSEISLPSEIGVEVLHGTFADRIEEVRQRMPGAFKSRAPLFVFVDPFGAKGVPFDVIGSILASPTSEVLLNFDADGITRVHKAGRHANHAVILDAIYGRNEWQRTFDVQHAFEVQCSEAANLYIRRLRSLPDVRYTFRFEMRSANHSLNYYLVFASKHPLGLEKMKEAMQKVDQTGEYCFSDGMVGQGHLFRFDKPEEHASAMHAAFTERTLSWNEIRDYVLNETPFIRPGTLLAPLVDQEKIEVIPVPHVRRKTHQFSDATILSVRFVKPPRGLFDGNEVAH